MARKTLTEKVVDIFISTIARDISKTALKKIKGSFTSSAVSRKRLRKNTEYLEPTNPTGDIDGEQNV
jgi:hypothetical protein